MYHFMLAICHPAPVIPLLCWATPALCLSPIIVLATHCCACHSWSRLSPIAALIVPHRSSHTAGRPAVLLSVATCSTHSPPIALLIPIVAPAISSSALVFHGADHSLPPHMSPCVRLPSPGLCLPFLTRTAHSPPFTLVIPTIVAITVP